MPPKMAHCGSSSDLFEDISSASYALNASAWTRIHDSVLPLSARAVPAECGRSVAVELSS
jgi:hypothetical protein